MVNRSARMGSYCVLAIIVALLFVLLPGCEGSSGTPIINVVSYDISGKILDNSGAPMAGVVLAFNGVQVQTASDGSFVFADVTQGTSSQLVPTSTGITFLPESRAVTIASANVTGMDFTGFALVGLQDTMPFVGDTGTLITIQLEAVNAAGQALAGFTTGVGTLSSSPSGMVVLTAPKFVDGQATAVVRFTAAGTYTISLSGICDLLDATLGTIQVAQGTTQPEVIYVEKWKSGAEAAISLTFDDGTEDHWSRGLDLWADYGFHVTLGILANRFQDNPARLPQLQEAFDAGHELANHSTTHPDLTTQSLAVVQQEISTCEQLLLNNVEGLDHVLTFIYPYEIYNDAVIAELQARGYAFARSGTQGITDYTPLNDPYNPPLMHLYAWANLNTLDQSLWDDTVDATLSAGGWLVEECHGIGAIGETGVGWSPRPESDFRTHYDHIASFGSRIWVATMGEIGCYVIERNNAQFVITENSADRIEFSLATGLDGEIYDIPLTLWLAKPTGWTTYRVMQNSVQLSATETEAGRIRFNVVPGSPVVSIERVQ